MINMFQVYEELSESLGEQAARVLTRVISRVHEEMQLTVTKVEFNELKNVVYELAEAQKRTEERVNELAEAQKKTEERLNKLTERVNELAEAQKRTEERINELAEAQKKTEERLNKLTERVNELAEAQKRTEEALTALIKRVDLIEERLEGLSNSVGYSLEDRAYKALPELLKNRGIKVHGRLIRKYIGDYQINIFGHGSRNGERVTIVGECKVRPSKKEINRFIKVVDRLAKKGDISNPLIIFVANDFHPHVELYLQEKGILYFWSYEF